MRNSTASFSTHFYDSSQRGPLALEELRGVVEYSGLIIQLIRRDVISRYKRSFLGFAWTMLNPLGTMLILTFVFSRVFKSIQGYPIYLLSGLVAWIFFSQATTAALSQNVWGGSLLHRIYLPRTTFTLSAIGTGLVNLVLSILPLFLIMAVLKFPFHPTLFFLPVPILLMACFALGVGLLFSTLALYFPDIVEMFQIGLTAWMYLTPIIYPVEIIDEVYRNWFINLNPMYYLILVFREVIYNGTIPTIQTLSIASAISVGMLILGWTIFCWKANEFTYHS